MTSFSSIYFCSLCPYISSEKKVPQWVSGWGQADKACQLRGQTGLVWITRLWNIWSAGLWNIKYIFNFNKIKSWKDCQKIKHTAYLCMHLLHIQAACRQCRYSCFVHQWSNANLAIGWAIKYRNAASDRGCSIWELEGQICHCDRIREAR